MFLPTPARISATSEKARLMRRFNSGLSTVDMLNKSKPISLTVRTTNASTRHYTPVSFDRVESKQTLEGQ